MAGYVRRIKPFLTREVSQRYVNPMISSDGRSLRKARPTFSGLSQVNDPGRVNPRRQRLTSDEQSNTVLRITESSS